MSSASSTSSYINPGFYTDRSGATVAYSSYQGKLVLLEAIQTGCESCRDLNHREIMSQLYNAFQDQVQFLIISVNPDDSLKNLNSFANDFSIQDEMGLDVNNSIASTYGVNLTPTSLILDENGFLLDFISGIRDFNVYRDSLNHYVENPINATGRQLPTTSNSLFKLVFTNPLFLGFIGVFVIASFYFNNTKNRKR